MHPDIRRHLGSTKGRELPEGLAGAYRRALKLEWITAGYLVSVGVVMFLAMGASSAMKAAWLEDVVSLFPAVAFLIASRVHNKSASARYPYGYHKAFTVAFVGGSLALLVLGLYVLLDSVLVLVRQHRPTIGSVNILGREIWAGWLMIAALFYSFLPAMILGRKKLPLAETLHERVLFVDAQAQKADWLTAAAGMIGVLGVGFGYWWLDAVAAILISSNVVFDGVMRCKDSMRDLLEELPMTFDNKAIHPLVADVIDCCMEEEWVDDVQVRMREHGMVFFGDVLIVSKSEEGLVDCIHALQAKLRALDWKIHDMVVSPVKSIPGR